MVNEIHQVSQLLMYDGPSATELVQKAVENGNDFKITNNGQITTLTINSVIAYNLKVTDVFTYNEEGQLIKQTLVMNGKEQIVFDKYREASNVLMKLSHKSVLVS
ncbi:hypothetical protein ERICIV_00310 [Paenibacillus larvae subsp. larvae]|uniref:Uncharacterized protein n=1 Tax=Paenibacillus larvae subsp. larvae TaxID=147375 RepID=A0A2L1TV59_9BACL|nr:hypothetical protein [Paenibacillus larvae]AQT85253.1 hypothetical protein B1222_13975 [Paenibacillus larvae subsp. pulvifaciens]AQZ47261.1 hypothetical protein B5S25_12360 [Paenibacillus larvae subsp. pulvifaciens]AVF24555.1 hypothetical protein ERICIII_00310 [Paenibacillus larvae subsp. larvae]AVF29316.1 hypothetical protein ERICIV_00310 [Paenibacillus larvae subsp. larvae]MBH0343693.1 hypothetical protein [Paenibacillus larvae]